MDMIKFKRGDTFILTCQVDEDLTGFTVRSQIRNGNSLVANLTYTIITLGATSVYELSFINTSSWPISILSSDIEYINPQGITISTETFYIDCVKDITI